MDVIFWKCTISIYKDFCRQKKSNESVMKHVIWALNCFKRLLNWLWFNYNIFKLSLLSLFYNEFADRYYVGDTCMEPMFWFVDHFTKILGPVCVVGVIVLSLSLIFIAYIIGLPFYLRQNAFVLALALIIGHWILVNVVFYYYMAFRTGPGYPPQGAMITEAVSICKRCIAPKPPRTHHCSVCNRCILKMDHHCPWLNNCIGHFNHSYFFMFCAYSWIGTVFVMIFGIPIAYEHFFGNSDQNAFAPEIINFVKSITKHLAFKTYILRENVVNGSDLVIDSEDSKSKWPETLYHSCIVYAALLCIAVFFVLGGLIAWHSRLISNGETSIEGHINKKERARFSKEGKIYKNPYDLGPIRNWKIFLGINFKRPWWYILLPSVCKPLGDGIQWNMYNVSEKEYSSSRKEASKICSVKIS